MQSEFYNFINVISGTTIFSLDHTRRDDYKSKSFEDEAIEQWQLHGICQQTQRDEFKPYKAFIGKTDWYFSSDKRFFLQFN